MRNLILILSFTLAALSGNKASAQQVLKCGGETYHISEFRLDTLKWNHHLDKYIGQIQQSKYDLEIRCTVTSVLNITRTPVVIIKGNKDSLFTESYLFVYGNKTNEADLAVKSPNHSPQIIHKRLSNVKYVDSVFKILIANNLFAMRNHQIIIDSLKAHNAAADPQLMALDGPPFYTIEIKLHDQYHSYNITESAIKFHAIVPDFVKGNAIRDIFRDLYEEVEKTR